MKAINIIALSCSTFIVASSFILDCLFESATFNPLGEFYSCDVQSDPNITSLDVAFVDNVVGLHASADNLTNTNDNVTAFHANKKNIKHFPCGLEKFFVNLEIIRIYQCGLKEVHQSDLKPFVAMKLLKLTNNHIQVIEQGLFKYNPLVTVISFERNQILQIHSIAFNKIENFIEINLLRNSCMFKKAYSLKDLRKLMEISRSNCLMPTEPEEEIDFEVTTNVELEDKFGSDTAGTNVGWRLAPQIFFMAVTVLLFLH